MIKYTIMFVETLCMYKLPHTQHFVHFIHYTYIFYSGVSGINIQGLLIVIVRIIRQAIGNTIYRLAHNLRFAVLYVAIDNIIQHLQLIVFV